MNGKWKTSCLGLVMATLAVSLAAASEEGGATAAWLHALASQAGRQVIEGRDDWLFLPADVRHLAHGPFWEPAGATAGDAVNPVPAILDFHARLRARGIELLLVPVPPKAALYAAALPGEGPVPAQPNRIAEKFHAYLREAGVEVLDLYPDFAERRDARLPVYCRQDTHWTPETCRFTAVLLAAWIRARPWAGGLDATAIFERLPAVPLNLQGDLRLMADIDLPPETVTLQPVQGDTVDRSSPVLLLGDSHVLVFHAGGDMHATRAGLADHLAAELGMPVDLLGVRGSGATPARVNLFRRAQAEPGYLDTKRLVIWCFTAREFTQNPQWRIIPLER